MQIISLKGRCDARKHAITQYNLLATEYRVGFQVRDMLTVRELRTRSVESGKGRHDDGNFCILCLTT